MIRRQRLVRELKRKGWTVRNSKGSHVILYCPCGEHIVRYSVGSGNQEHAHPGMKNTVMRILRCPKAGLRKRELLV